MYYGNLEFKVKVENGEVFIDFGDGNGYKFISQLCWDNDSIGLAVSQALYEYDMDVKDEEIRHEAEYLSDESGFLV